MALLLHTPPNADLAVQPRTVVQTQATAVGHYRCVGCGELLHFNALAITCQCVDDCYSRSEPVSGAHSGQG